MNSHVKSKKHKENVFRAASQVKVSDLQQPPAEATQSSPDTDMEADADADAESAEPVASTSTALAPPASISSETVDFESSGDPKLDLLVARRIRTAPPIPATSCLFCTHTSSSPQDNISHMRSAHSFLIPEIEYLVDLEGLLKRLGEEVGTWNVCIYCGKGYGGNISLDAEGTDEELRKKASKGVEAVRAHMQDKVG